MGSDLYHCKVIYLSKKEKRVKFRLKCIHPDANYFPATASFAFLVLFESAEPRTSPLNNDISNISFLLDNNWVRENLHRFIHDVGYQNKAGNENAGDFQNEAWVQFTINLKVTHSKFLEHLTMIPQKYSNNNINNNNQIYQFDSRAFDVIGDQLLENYNPSMYFNDINQMWHQNLFVKKTGRALRSRKGRFNFNYRKTKIQK